MTSAFDWCTGDGIASNLSFLRAFVFSYFADTSGVLLLNRTLSVSSEAKVTFFEPLLGSALFFAASFFLGWGWYRLERRRPEAIAPRPRDRRALLVGMASSCSSSLSSFSSSSPLSSSSEPASSSASLSLDSSS